MMPDIPDPIAPPVRTAAAAASREVFHAAPAKIARVRRHLLDEQAGAALADTFKVLGDLTRVRLLHALAQAELCVGDLAALVGLSESAVSHQLRLLRSVRIVRARRSGRLVLYALDDEHIIGLFEQGLKHVTEAAPRRRGEPGDGHRPAVAAGDRVPAPRRRGAAR